MTCVDMHGKVPKISFVIEDLVTKSGHSFVLTQNPHRCIDELNDNGTSGLTLRLPNTPAQRFCTSYSGGITTSLKRSFSSMFVESSTLHRRINPMTLREIARTSTTLVKMMNQATANACRTKPECAKTTTVLLVKHIDNCVKSSFSVVINADYHDKTIDCIVDGFDEKIPSLKRDSSGTKEKESVIHKPDAILGDMNQNVVLDNNDIDVPWLEHYLACGKIHSSYH